MWGFLAFPCILHGSRNNRLAESRYHGAWVRKSWDSSWKMKYSQTPPQQNYRFHEVFLITRPHPIGFNVSQLPSQRTTFSSFFWFNKTFPRHKSLDLPDKKSRKLFLIVSNAGNYRNNIISWLLTAQTAINAPKSRVTCRMLSNQGGAIAYFWWKCSAAFCDSLRAWDKQHSRKLKPSRIHTFYIGCWRKQSFVSVLAKMLVDLCFTTWAFTCFYFLCVCFLVYGSAKANGGAAKQET